MAATFKIVFLREAPGVKPTAGGAGEATEVVVDPLGPPSSGVGQPGSLLDLALASGVDIDHACGGVAACSTCHVQVIEGLESCNESSEDEEDQLDEAPGVTFQSRLACQCVPSGARDLTVRIPSWNRNLAREGGD